MQIQSKHILTMLVMAGVSLTAFQAKAATTFSNGDLLVGFRAVSGQNNNISIVANLGSTITLRNNDTTPVVIGNIGAELTAVYGANWASNADIYWGAVGVYDPLTVGNGGQANNGDPAQTLYMTRQNTSGTEGVYGSGTLNTSGTTGHTTVASSINALQTSFAAFTGTTTQGGLVAQMDTSAPNTFEDYTSGGSDFSVGQNVDNSVSTAGGRILDLYRILGTATGANPTGTARTGQWQGTLSLGTDGSITFSPTVAAVPEPSRVIFMAAGLSALVLRRRRRA